MQTEKNVTLSLYPNMRGLGYVCLEDPKALVDYGVITIRPISNDKIFQRIQKFVEFFQPTIILLRDWDTPATRKNERMRQLLERIAAYASEKQIPLQQYKRQQIRDVFEQFGATTKYEIAHQIIREFDELASRAPRLREQWMEEDYNMGIFDAVALVTTHKYLTQ